MLFRSKFSSLPVEMLLPGPTAQLLPEDIPHNAAFLKLHTFTVVVCCHSPNSAGIITDLIFLFEASYALKKI